MPKIIVSVVNEIDKDTRDFEIPSSMKAREVSDRLAEAFGAHKDVLYQLQAYPAGRVLEQHETLESAGIWDGSLLVLQEVARHQTPASRGLAASRSPVSGWRSLDVALPREEAPSKSRQQREFVWKRLD